jgi:hypothetical protein
LAGLDDAALIDGVDVTLAPEYVQKPWTTLECKRQTDSKRVFGRRQTDFALSGSRKLPIGGLRLRIKVVSSSSPEKVCAIGAADALCPNEERSISRDL